MKTRIAILICFALVSPCSSISAQDLPIINKTNWLKPGINTRSLQHTGLAQFTTMVSRQGTPPSQLEFAPISLDDFSYEGIDNGRSKIIAFGDYLRLTHTDSFLVRHNGKVVFERYFNGMAPHQRHLMMSVTKSFTGTIVAMLIDAGKIDDSAKVTDYVPELAASAWARCTVRDVMDMRAGINYSEVYEDPDSDVWKYGASIGLFPTPRDYTGPGTIREYLATMSRKEKPNGHFEYVTPCTEVLVWIVCNVTEKPFNEVLSDRIWSKLGMECDAQFMTEPGNQPLGGTGLMATARDLSRFGQMLLQRGTYNDRQILNPEIVDRFMAGGDRQAFQRYADEHPAQQGFTYRDQWWVTHNEHGAFAAMGVYGQIIFIDPTANMVIVKQSSLPAAVTEFADYNDFRLFHALAKHLMQD